MKNSLQLVYLLPLLPYLLLRLKGIGLIPKLIFVTLGELGLLLCLVSFFAITKIDLFMLMAFLVNLPVIFLMIVNVSVILVLSVVKRVKE